MSDDEYSFAGKPFIPINEIEEDQTPLQPGQPPANAIQYLRLVQTEAKQLDDVVVVRIDESKVKKQTVVYKAEEKPSSSLSPSREWKDCQVKDFGDLRFELAKLLDDCPVSTVELPQKKSEGGWCVFCLGTEFARRVPSLCDQKQVKDGDVVAGNPPLTRYICAMNQMTVETVLEYHVNWLNCVDGFSDEQGRWLYALLVRLGTPLTPDMCSLLRTLARTCAQKRDELACQDEAGVKCQALVTSLNLLICLVALYFRQLDLEDI